MPHISHSGLSKFQSCPFKYKLRYIDGIRDSGSIYTAFGHSVHATCENILVGKLPTRDDIKQFFTQNFKDELKVLDDDYLDKVFNPQTDKDKKLLSILKDMKRKGAWLSFLAIEALKKKFPGFKVLGAECEIEEDITEYEGKDDYEFKGIIDLVLELPDGSYVIVDWKTCSWGWDAKKKTDKLVTYQLSYYKHFYTLKHNLDPKKTKTFFALIKRTAFTKNKQTNILRPKDNIVEFVPVGNGPRKIRNSLNLLNETLYNIDHGVFPKNRLSCKGCEYHKTEWCP